MKKYIVVILLLCNTLFSFSQDCEWERFKKATDDNNPKGKALTEAMDENPKLIDIWEELDDIGLDEIVKNNAKKLEDISEHIEKGIHDIDDIKIGINNAKDVKEWADDLKKGVYRNGNKAEFINQSGSTLTWTDQHPNSLDIEGALPPVGQNVTTGKQAEAVVADFIKKEGKEIEGFGLGIHNKTANTPAGDIDVLTKNEIIEVKKSYSSFKKGQIDKFVNVSMPNFLNPDNKKAILYIHELLTEFQKSSILGRIPENVTLVNSLEELKKILQ